MNDDITYCKNGWNECMVTRCERHPSNILHPEEPHSYAELYRMEYCLLQETNLKPCPFCGAVPTIKWEAWKEISPTCGIWVLEAEHRNGCYIRFMNGTNSTGQACGTNKQRLADAWNKRASNDE